MVAYKRIKTEDKDVEEIQDGIEEAVKALSTDISDGILLKGIELTTGLNTVNHKLGTSPQGYIVTNLNANTAIWRSTGDNQDRFMYLNVSTNCTVDLWVFK